MANKRLSLFLVFLLFCSCQYISARHQFFKARQLYEQGSYLEAIRLWEMILTQSPKSKWADDALHWIGMTYYVELNFPERAIDSFSRLVKNYPHSTYAPQDQALLAEILRARGQYARALIEYYRFLKLFPENELTPKVWYRLITCLFEVGEYKAMRAQAQAMLKKFPKSTFADDCLFWIGESYFLQEDYKKAREYFQKYLDGYPDGELYFRAGINLARTYEEEGNLEKAIDKYLELKSRFPTDPVLEARLQSAKKRYFKKYKRKYPLAEKK